ncbi:MAG: hypothetical protein DI586_10205 [Micavibrio aeruginosavorus]|uniref:Glycosyl transferase family 1 domain-containing protein n=1 Tax=Micavibrio aeruginosavorus TaxID=349221 RepID=A0A2W5H881_9BACT|nr:MAG: hypothetical protein DI586_10205 [Micavibrio aeruginosavorus]
MKKTGIISSLVTTTFHGFDLSQILKEKNPDYYDGLFATGTHFFSINDYYLKIIHGLGAPVEKTSLFHMGVDCKALSFHPRTCPVDGVTECISVGRMTEKKGFETTIRAFAYTAASKPDMHLHLVGDGPLMEEMKALASSLDIAAKITFHGALQHEEVKELLVRAHIFLLPSVTAQSGDMEGIPVALMEAMAMGIPVFSTFHSGIPELIEDGISGFLIQEKDYVSLAGKLAYLLDRPEIWKDITMAARRKVEVDFNREIQSRILFDTFQNLVKNFHA